MWPIQSCWISQAKWLNDERTCRWSFRLPFLYLLYSVAEFYINSVRTVMIKNIILLFFFLFILWRDSLKTTNWTTFHNCVLYLQILAFKPVLKLSEFVHHLVINIGRKLNLSLTRICLLYPLISFHISVSSNLNWVR